MKRTDITELFPDAPKEAVDKIMSLNGADVNAVRAEAEQLRQQLAEAGAKGGEELQKAQKQVADLTEEINGMKAAEALRIMRGKVAQEKKVPAHLLTGETEEACAAQADAILAFAQPSGYPQLRDGGEIHNTPQPTTREKFANWAKENL